MVKTKERIKKNTVSFVLVIVLVLTAVMVPIYSQAGTETSYDYETVNMSGSYTSIDYGLMYYYTTDKKMAGIATAYMTYDVNGETQEAYCIQAQQNDPKGEMVISDAAIKNLSPQAQNAIQAVIDADLSTLAESYLSSLSEEILTTLSALGVNNFASLYPKNSAAAENNVHREYYIKQLAILYIVDILDGAKSNPKEARYPLWQSLFDSISNPENEVSKAVSSTSDAYYNYVTRLGFVKTLVNEAWDPNGKVKPIGETTFEITPKDVTFTYDDNTKSYVSSLIQSNPNDNVSGSIDYNVTAINESGDTVSGYTYLDSNGNTIDNPSSNGFRISIPKNSIKPGEEVDVTVDANAKMPLRKYAFYRSTAGKLGNGLYYQNIASAIKLSALTTLSDSTSGQLTRDIVTGSIDILKYDADDEDKVLSGASFTLSYKDGEEVVNGITGTDGTLSFDNLDVYGDDQGTIGVEYTLTETKAPAGYERYDLYTTTFALTDDNKSLAFEVPNNTIKYGQIEIIKIDSTDNTKVLSGASFTLFDTDGNTVVKEGVTDENGYLKFDELDVYGNDGKGKTYRLMETKAPEGYSNADLFAETFTMTNDSYSMEYTVENTLQSVLGEEDYPTTTGSESDESSVLGEEASDDEDSKVLGEEAQTSDIMNFVFLLLVLAMVSLIMMLAIVKTRSGKE